VLCSSLICWIRCDRRTGETTRSDPYLLLLDGLKEITSIRTMDPSAFFLAPNGDRGLFRCPLPAADSFSFSLAPRGGVGAISILPNRFEIFETSPSCASSPSAVLWGAFGFGAETGGASRIALDCREQTVIGVLATDGAIDGSSGGALFRSGEQSTNCASDRTLSLLAIELMSLIPLRSILTECSIAWRSSGDIGVRDSVIAVSSTSKMGESWFLNPTLPTLAAAAFEGLARDLVVEAEHFLFLN